MIFLGMKIESSLEKVLEHRRSARLAGVKKSREEFKSKIKN